LLEGFLKMQDTETDGSIPYAPPPDGKKWAALLGLLRFKLNGSELRLAVYLIHKANPKTGQCNPGTNCIMADLEITERTIERSCAGLRRRGIIRSKQRHRTTSNDYWINWRALVGKARPHVSASTRQFLGAIKRAEQFCKTPNQGTHNDLRRRSDTTASAAGEVSDHSGPHLSNALSRRA
jgi:hypothetical protein